MQDCKMYSCGMCGHPCKEDGTLLEIPKVYNPDLHEHTYCIDCHNAELEKERMIVTHEMAMDAEMPELEGTVW